MTNPAIYVQPIHFEDFGGPQFERLVFAYHWRIEKWRSLEWYGQTGSDLGRDIWGIRKDGTSICIQCANRRQLTFAKTEEDIAKVLKAPNGMPQCFRIVAQSNISADMRDRIKKHIKSLGVSECDIWSGAEFEEFLRHGAESLLKRFVGGQVFPDTASELTLLAQTEGSLNDSEILASMAKLFDRPAFYTPIHEESNLPDFKQAITDTIQALGTGIWKARDGHVIGRIPSRHQLGEKALSTQIQSVEMALTKLRTKFDAFLKSGVIRPCGCKQPDCPTYTMPSEAAHVLEQLRGDVLRQFQDAYPAFNGGSERALAGADRQRPDPGDERSAEEARAAVVRTYFAPELARIAARQVYILDRTVANFVTASVGKNPLPGDSWASLRPWKPILYPDAAKFRDLKAEDATLLVNFYDSLQEITDIVENYVDNQAITDFNSWNFLMQKVQHNLSVGQIAVRQFCPENQYDATMPASGTLLDRSETAISTAKAALAGHLSRRGIK